MYIVVVLGGAHIVVVLGWEDLFYSLCLLLFCHLRVSRGRALWACPPNSVLPTGEPLPVLKPQVHGWRGGGGGGGHFGHVFTPSQTLDLPLPLSHISLPSSLTRPPPLPGQAHLGIPLQGGRANVFVGGENNTFLKTS